MNPGQTSPAHQPCGRVSLSTATKRRLWAESSGYCQNPECGLYLFQNDDVDFAEMAHIIAATRGGPRDGSSQEMTDVDRAHHTNIAVLCANCHTLVDKSPEKFPADQIRHWKARHIDAQQRAFGTPVFSTRNPARSYIEPLLQENRSIVSSYGPADDSISAEHAQSWRHHATRTIIPNNQKIDRVLRANRALLTTQEQQTADAFSIHQVEFALRHLLGDYDAGMSRFPNRMDNILIGEK